MACKYPKESRMHYACILCGEKNVCKDTIVFPYSNNLNIPPMPKVQPPKNVIPFAHEANNMTKHVIDGRTTQQLEELTKQIKAAIADGKSSVNLDGSLDPEIRKKLEELGYKVEIGNQYNEWYCIISWK